MTNAGKFGLNVDYRFTDKAGFSNFKAFHIPIYVLCIFLWPYAYMVCRDANLHKYRMVCGKKIACDVYLIQVSVFDYVTFLLFLFSLFSNRLILTTTKYCDYIELIY